MKRVKQVLCGVLAAALMIPLAAASPGSGSKSLSDIQGHWAQKEIETAIASGWVDGYPDGTFKPEKTITRAEFTKMLLDAIHLTPDSETVAWMKESARTGMVAMVQSEKYTPRLNDMGGHWLTTQGWTEAALYSGMVVPEDYNGQNFRPEKEIARYEIALMTDRALGLVNPANAYNGEALPFADNEEILDWMKGYVNEAVKAGVLQGYPDNTFRPNKTSTRAEAVVMVQRMLDEMEQGVDPDITVIAQYRKVEDSVYEIVASEETEDIRLQIVDDVIYASLHDLHAQLRKMMMADGKNSLGSLEWFPIEQRGTYWLSGGNEPEGYDYWMGSSQYYYWIMKEFCVPVRALYGEMMIPVCDLQHPSSEPQKTGWEAGWDGETNTLTIPMFYQRPTFNGS